MEYIQYSWQLLLVSIFIYILSIFFAKPNITYNNPQCNVKSKGLIGFFFLLILNSVFALWEYDTYHAWNTFIFTNRYSNCEISQYEEVYNWLARVSYNSYFLWRAYIWIPACLFMYYTAKRLDLLNRNFLVAMLLFGSFLSFTRGMLGHAMLVFAMVLFVDKRSNMLTKIIGLALVCVSYYFHKSMYVNIIFAVLALYPFGNKTIKLSLLAFPFLTIVATHFINEIAIGSIEITLGDGVGGTGDTSVGYASKERVEANIYGLIAKIVAIVPQYLTLFYLYNRVIIQKVFDKDKRERIYNYLFRLTYVAFYIASLFYFVETSNWIYERFKYMGFFPMVFILGAVWCKENSSTKWLKAIILLQAFAIIWMLIYRLYKWYGL